MEKNTIKVAIYSRVSTIDQNVKQQSKHIRKWCYNNDYGVELAVLDTESGRLPLTDRKNFKKLLDKAVQLGLPVVVLSLDRLTRNWDDITMIEKHFRDRWDVSPLICCNELVDLSNASGRLMFRIKMAVNCNMPEEMREKQVIGIERAKKEKKYKGRKIGSKNKELYRRNRN